MRLQYRNFMTLLVQGRKETLLSFYLQILKEDLPWINDESFPEQQALILNELKRLLLENLDEIERQYKLEKRQFVHLTNSDRLRVSFLVRNGKVVETLQIEETVSGMEGKVKHFFQPNFHLIIWIFRPSTSSSLIPQQTSPGENILLLEEI